MGIQMPMSRCESVVFLEGKTLSDVKLGITPAFLIIQRTDAQGNRATCTRMLTEALFRI